MPDVTELLSEDHREVEQMFAEYEQTKDPAVVEQICQELTIHTQVEEEIVYPVLAELDRELEREGEHEHDEAKHLIEQIRSAMPDGAELSSLVQQLKESVEHHVEEEESEAWPQLREGAGETLDDMGAAVEQRKQELMSGGGGGGSVPEDATKEELYEQAKEAGVEGRSKMDKDELREAVEQQS